MLNATDGGLPTSVNMTETFNWVVTFNYLVPACLRAVTSRWQRLSHASVRQWEYDVCNLVVCGLSAGLCHATRWARRRGAGGAFWVSGRLFGEISRQTFTFSMSASTLWREGGFKLDIPSPSGKLFFFLVWQNSAKSEDTDPVDVFSETSRGSAEWMLC